MGHLNIVAGSAFLIALLAFLVSLRLFIKYRTRHAEIMVDYKPVEALKKVSGDLLWDYLELQRNYENQRDDLKRLERTIHTYELGVGTIDAFTYTPLFDTRDVEVLERELEKTKEYAKELVKAKKACISLLPKNMVLNDKKSAAKTFVNREIRLRIRCLDNEVKAAIAAVEWNNINRLVQRVKSKFDEINADSKLVKIFLEQDYLEAKVRELRLHYEIKQLKADLKEEEREERQRIREEERDQERVRQQLEKAQRDREKMQKLVERELAKMAEATEEQKELLALHQKELDLLKEKESRAMSLAQQTRAGYVYIISNTASFGEGICKIGMTRRLDPQDRVKELGDASVPELFDVHAFIYSQDAPALEKYLHDRFSAVRLNLVNRRKEFFFAQPEEVIKAVEDYEGEVLLDLNDDLAYV